MDEHSKDNWRDVLWREWNAEDDSFVFNLRVNGKWDFAAFDRLFNAMLECCKAHEGQQVIERWPSGLFYYLSWWPKQNVEEFFGWSNDDYYDNAVTNLDHLAWWLFEGLSRGDDEFEPMDKPPAMG